MPTPHEPSIAVRRTLRALGQNIREARLRRNLSAAVVAGRAFTSRPTLMRIEKGDSGVGVGIYASVLQALGQLEALGNIASIESDKVGQDLIAQNLPLRVRVRKAKA